MVSELAAYGMYIIVDSEVLELCDPVSWIATWIDSCERGQVHIDVQRKAVITAASCDAQAERGNLRLFDVYTWGRNIAGCLDTVVREQVYHGAFHEPNERAD